MDCQGYMASLARNVEKLVRRLNRGVCPPDPELPTAVETSETTVTEGTREDAVHNSPVAPQYRLRQCRLTKDPSPGIRWLL